MKDYVFEAVKLLVCLLLFCSIFAPYELLVSNALLLNSHVDLGLYLYFIQPQTHAVV